MAFRNLAGRIARPKANILAEQGAQDFLAASGCRIGVPLVIAGGYILLGTL